MVHLREASVVHTELLVGEDGPRYDEGSPPAISTEGRPTTYDT
jgi:hypothetical protein